MAIRRSVLLIDDDVNSRFALKLLKDDMIEFVEDNIRFEVCCVELPTTKAPSLIAPEGIFRNIEGLKVYLTVEKRNVFPEPDESAYW